jgi:hypothetical protein
MQILWFLFFIFTVSTSHNICVASMAPCEQPSYLQYAIRVGKGGKCSKCGYKSKKYSDIVKHVALHAGYKPFECNICGHSAYFKSGLKNHMHTFHPENSTPSKRQRTDEQERHREEDGTSSLDWQEPPLAHDGSIKLDDDAPSSPSTPTDYVCWHCDETFDTAEDYFNHLDTIDPYVGLLKSLTAEGFPYDNE